MESDGEWEDMNVDNSNSGFSTSDPSSESEPQNELDLNYMIYRLWIVQTDSNSFYWKHAFSKELDTAVIIIYDSTFWCSPFFHTIPIYY